MKSKSKQSTNTLAADLLMIRRTIEEVHREEVTLEVRKRTLLLQLKERWGSLPEQTVQAIETTDNAELLRTWLRRFATANDLASVGIVPTS